MTRVNQLIKWELYHRFATAARDVSGPAPEGKSGMVVDKFTLGPWAGYQPAPPPLGGSLRA
jgi:hypothetical protein